MKTAEGQLALAERQVEAGSAPKRAVIQAQLRVSEARRELASAQERVAAAEEAFTRTTGLPRDTVLDEPAPPQVPASLETAMADAKVTRPDLKAADLRVKVARLDHRAKNLEWFPVVTGNFTTIFTENTGFADNNVYWVAAINLDWTIWDGGLRLAQAREKASIKRVSELMLIKQGQIADEEVRIAWERYQRAEKAMVAVDDEVALAAENLELSRRGFEAGLATWLEVEQAELSLQMSQLNGLNERMNRDLAAVDLLVATGAF